MSFDYDRLRELADECTTGQWQSHIYEPDPYCYPGATRFLIAADWDRVEIAEGQAGPSTKSTEYARKANDFELMALAPDLARELLALRDEIERTRDRVADELERTPAELKAARITLYTEREHFHAFCNDLLEEGNE